MFELTDHILAVVYQNDRYLTSRKLQFILYFTFREIVKQLNDQPSILNHIYNLPFYVWRYGPVIPEIYQHYHIYESDPITDFGHYSDYYANLFSNHKLDQIILNFIDQPTDSLESIAKANSFYQNHIQDIKAWRSDIPYTILDILA